MPRTMSFTARSASLPPNHSANSGRWCCFICRCRRSRPSNSWKRASPRPADAIYSWAQMLEEDGIYGMALAAYYLAKDLDALRFRASDDFNEIIHQVAAEYKAPV